MYFKTNILFILSLSGLCINYVFGEASSEKNRKTPPPVPLRIAIVGAGVGGSAAAYYLTKLFNGDIEIDLFESTSIIGGRLATQDIFGNEYENGGSIIHPRNKLAVDLVKELGLSQRADTSSGVTTLVKDSEFIFSTSSWTLVTIWRIYRRYGFDFNRLNSMTSGMIDEFERIYGLLDQGQSFQTVDKLLSAMSPALLNLTKFDFHTYLTEQGYKQNFIEEMVQAICNVNYGQNTSVLHSLVGAISAAGAQNGLWSVAGGNKNLPITLLNHSIAQVHLNSKVVAVKHAGSKFELGFEERKTPQPAMYDKVVLSIPFINSVHFQNLDAKAEANVKKSRFYHRTVSTIVAADGLQEKYKDLGSLISITPNYYTSVSRIHPVVLRVAEKVPVYKVFSQDLLTEIQLNEMFLNPRKVSVNDWFAYPQYDSIDTLNSVNDFTVFPGIYHPNNIEWAASAIEMSLISAKNVALLVHNSVAPKKPNSAASNEGLFGKTEL